MLSASIRGAGEVPMGFEAPCHAANANVGGRACSSNSTLFFFLVKLLTRGPEEELELMTISTCSV